MNSGIGAFSVRLSSILLLAGVIALGSTGAEAAPKAIRLTNTDAQHTAYLRIPHSPALEPQQFTFEAWITPLGLGYGATNDALGAVVLAKPREGAGGSWLASYSLDWSPLTHKVNFVLVHTYQSQGIFLVSNAVLLIGQTAHIGVVFDGQEVRLYINGQLDAFCAFPYQGVYYGVEDVLIGAGNLSGSYLRRFDGVIDDVRMWNYPKSEEEIAGDMNCLLAGDEAGLLAWWSFDNDLLVDNSGNGHDAQMNGVPGMATFVPPNAPIELCGLALSSSSEAYAYPIDGSVQGQLAALNAGPPAFSPAWVQVLRHSGTTFQYRSAFQCGVPVGLIQTSGSMDVIPAPPSVDFDDLESNTLIRVFPERQNVELSQDISVNAVVPGRYEKLADLPEPAPTIQAGTVVSSYLLHFDTVDGDHQVTGKVEFDTEVLGVCVLAEELFASDGMLGAPGTSYPSSSDPEGFIRQLEFGAIVDDWITIEPDGRSVTLHPRVENWNDQMRIITRGAVSDPTGMPYIDTETFQSNADEVTRDNCGSAFYRFTFDLPVWASNPRMELDVNCDDIGVAYLNGHRLTAGLAETDRYGTDRVDGDGLVLLSAPTLDTAGTTGATTFVVGQNELVFGVCGDAGPSEPTGLEFTGSVRYDVAAAVEDPEPEMAARGYVRPNPTRSSAVMALWSRKSGPVEAEVFSAAGRSVRTLRAMSLGGGLVEFLWDGADHGGSRVPAGVYFVRMPTDHGTSSQRLVIVR
jgi:hypothetical protein